MGQFITLTSADNHSFAAYEALPDGKAIGGLVLLQEIFGVNQHIQETADLYASLGYRVIAVPTMSRIQENVNLGYSEDDMKAGFAIKTAVDELPNNPVMDDIQTAIAHLMPFGKVGIFGFCWGGLLAWKSACQLRGLSAAVTYYGGGMPNFADLKPSCPVLSHFAEDDSYLPLDAVKAFEKSQPSVKVFIYPGHHGFNCDHRGAYLESSAVMARARTIEFFKSHLST